MIYPKNSVPNIAGLRRLEGIKNLLPSRYPWLKGYPVCPMFQNLDVNRRIYWLLDLKKPNSLTRFNSNNRKRLPHSSERKRLLRKIEDYQFKHWLDYNSSDAGEVYIKYRPESYHSWEKKSISNELLISSGVTLYVSDMLVRGKVVSRIIYGELNDSLYYVVPSSERSPWSYGLLHLLELIDEAKRRGYSFFSALVSKGVKGYKRKIFIDSYEVI